MKFSEWVVIREARKNAKKQGEEWGADWGPLTPDQVAKNQSEPVPYSAPPEPQNPRMYRQTHNYKRRIIRKGETLS